MAKLGEMIVTLGADNKDLKKGMKESQNIIQGTLDTIGSMKAELLSIGSIAGPIAAIRSWAGAVNDLEDKTNMAGESASKLLAVGQYVGLSTEEMSGAMAKMSKSVMTAAQQIETSGDKSTDVFTRFGIQVLDSNGKLLSAEQILDNVTAKHRNMANGVEKTAMEMEIFGRSGAKLNDLLNLSASEMNSVKDMAEKTGLVLNHSTTQAFEDAEFAVNKSKLAMKGLTASIGAAMLPQLQSVSKMLTDLSVNFASLDNEERKNIATVLEIAAAVSALSIGWRGLMFLSAPLVSAIDTVALAYTRLAASAWAAKAAVAGVVLAAAAAAAYKGYEDYQHYQAGGDFEYDDLGNVTPKEGTTYSSGSSDDWDLVSSPSFNQATGEYDIPTGEYDIPTVDFGGAGGGGGSGGGGGGGGGSAAKGAEQAVKEISEINKQISELTQKANDFATEWTQAELEIAKAGADGGALVLANIYTEGEARKKSVDDWLNKVQDATITAQQIYERAVKSGDESAIASAQAMLDERKNAEIQAMQETADAKKEIDRQTTDELMSNATALQTFKSELDEAMKQGDYEQFMQSMSDENIAFASQMSERQAIMQQYYDWRMEAEQSFSEYSLQMAEQLKTSLGQAAAGALVYGESFSKAMKDMIKSLVAMYIQWSVEKLAASALSKTIMTKESATVAAQGAAMAASLAPAAWAKLVLSPGSAAIATGLLSTGMAAAAGIGAAIGGLGGGLGGLSSAGGAISVSGGDIEGVPALASGGIVTAPTLALIGEAGDEAVIPLSKMGDMFGGGGQVVATQNIYGDINTGADSDDMFSDFSSLVMSGLRGV